MTNQFQFNNITLELNRYPANSNDNLQAWDAADEHLLKQLNADVAQQSLLLMNDSFGALLCALKKQFVDCHLTWFSDAKTSLLGCQQNLQHNQLSESDIDWLHPLQTPVTAPTIVLLKLPKNLNYFVEQLRMLTQWLAPESQLLIGAKAKNINQALLHSIEVNFGSASASLAWKKTRVISAKFDGKRRAIPEIQRWQTEDGIKLIGLANVFAASKLDIGARLMLAHYPEGNFKHVVDLGCGNGVLGLQAALRYPQAHIHFVDDSFEAVSSAEQGWHANQLDTHRGHFHWDDCLTHLPTEQAPDLILCNPPFHQGEAITDHIAWQMFMDAKKRLIDGGMLQVVGNRHLGYHVKLKRLFGNCTTVASNQKFVILRSIK
ncbi:50S rRNA methyltransferase [Shewanella mangrovi]|uniref:Ribosomal RNA large subunit methyltransferase G n=1 Tax=Shewanella mangrovi TaxID=1515746 RepID=A0A094J926_9GAMM|nr:methyltransferase [Shewanella mangrovi]KFZ36390.1 50S rRNA methyltransferase [Shewanella mangrovi]